MKRKLLNRIPRLPWIPFEAIARLDGLLTRDSVVWEVGSGFSTLWLSQRAKKVTSIEASRAWFERLSALIGHEGIRNVDLRFEWQAERMADFSELPDESLDLLFVDGGPRGECLLNGFPKVRGGGYVYLDNWDSRHFWGPASEFPETHAARIAWKQSFIDYVPAQFGVYEGLLIQKR